MQLTPLQKVKAQFESKQALVELLMTSLERPDGLNKDEWKSLLMKAPSSKLLNLHKTMTVVKERFGSKEALVDSICELKFTGRKVDQDYRTSLMKLSLGRLVNAQQGLKRRQSA